MKSRKNYFEEIKNHRVEDKFIEHFIRLIFFTFVIAMGSIYQRVRGMLFHIKNFLLSRSMSDVLAKYSKYKESVHSIMGKAVHNKKLPLQIHDAINTHFSEYEKRIIFGFKESKETIVNGSRKLISSVKGYTWRMRARYFEYIPDMNRTKRVSSALMSVLLARRSGKKISEKKVNTAIHETVNYLNSISGSYKKYMTDKFEKFYNDDFRKKISESSGMKTVRHNIEKFAETVKRAEQKHIRCGLENSSN